MDINIAIMIAFLTIYFLSVAFISFEACVDRNIRFWQFYISEEEDFNVAGNILKWIMLIPIAIIYIIWIFGSMSIYILWKGGLDNMFKLIFTKAKDITDTKIIIMNAYEKYLKPLEENDYKF